MIIQRESRWGTYVQRALVVAAVITGAIATFAVFDEINRRYLETHPAHAINGDPENVKSK